MSNECKNQIKIWFSTGDRPRTSRDAFISALAPWPVPPFQPFALLQRSWPGQKQANEQAENVQPCVGAQFAPGRDYALSQDEEFALTLQALTEAYFLRSV